MKPLIACLFLFVFVAQSIFAQVALLDIKVSMQTNKPIKEVIEEIGAQYKIPFVYSDNIFEDKPIVNQNYKDIPLAIFLENYFKNQDIAFKEFGGNIILYYKKSVPQKYILTGFVHNSLNSEDVIGATIYFPELKIGTITNAYGFFSVKIPEGNHIMQISCLSYHNLIKEINVIENLRIREKLTPKTFNVQEVVVESEKKQFFLESDLINMSKMDIETLQELPGLLGENDALRNLSLFPGIQTNEHSTSSINVRGGSTDQTLFLMDEANLYNASHFGGMFSVFNPDVVNNVNVYKGDIPVSEGGALSSLIDVRLREGDKQQWKVNGGIGLISARASVEGPLKKDHSSMLFAFRRTYIDKIIKTLTTDTDLKNTNFNFYDANLKMNFKINKNNRLFLSGYSGVDKFEQYSKLTRENHLGTFRWNHLFGSNLFSNTSFIVSKNIMTQGNKGRDDFVFWKSDVNNIKFKTDLTFFSSDVYKISLGYSSNFYTIDPFTVLSETEENLNTQFQSERERLMLNGFYVNQHLFMLKRISLDLGVRLTHMSTVPFTDSLIGLKEWFWEPQLKLGFKLFDKSTVKASYSHHVQPLHQLPLSMIGIAINRWMPASLNYLPQESRNLSVGYYKRYVKYLNFSVESYYRRMDNLIETLGDLQIVNTDNPEALLYNAKGTAYGAEFMFSFQKDNYKAVVSYDYCKAMWSTEGLNAGEPYPATHNREHSFNFSNIYKINPRIHASISWMMASGIPFTAAIAKYRTDGRIYLEFDIEKINTKKLPSYHRLDLSVDIAGKKNNSRKWKSFWNFSIYNAYFHKNALGVAYFVPEADGSATAEDLEPGYFYLYQFVPSISYRFNF